MDGQRHDVVAQQESVTERLRGTEQRLREIETQLGERLKLRGQHRARNVNEQMQDSFSPLDRIALVITTHVGTFGFFLIILSWTVLWLGYNLIAPEGARFDPAPAFVLWLFISNMIQIFLMPLIMVGQNLQGRHAELRAENDFEINQKAEQEVEAILLHLEKQAALIEKQGEQILQILRCVDTDTAQGHEESRPSMVSPTGM